MAHLERDMQKRRGTAPLSDILGQNVAKNHSLCLMCQFVGLTREFVGLIRKFLGLTHEFVGLIFACLRTTDKPQYNFPL
jgi:hypothetical protein